MSSPDDLKSTPRYDRIVAASRRVAFELGHSYVGVEHLFLAIVQDQAAVPTQVLSRFVDPRAVGEAVRALITSEDWGGRGKGQK
jgi:ATP-dependent Clp protease ATP-binding subunit ClpA